MKKYLLFVIVALFSTISLAQEPEKDLEDMTVAEKALLKMLFKSFVTPPFAAPFNTIEEELNIKVFSASMYEGMELVMMCTMDIDEMEFPSEEDETLDPDSFVYGTLTHFSGVEVRYMQAVKKDKSLKLRTYILNHKGNAFLINYKSAVKDFDKGIKAANDVATHIRKK